MISKKFTAYLILIIVALYIILPHDNHKLVHYVLSTKRGNVSLWLEEAKNELARSRGLMWRKDLSDKQGMLFIYDKEEQVAFWMKDTFIPLDIIFFNDKGYVVDIKEQTTPESIEKIIPIPLCKYVIEINAGEVKKYGIKVGDRLLLKK